ncbi:MAG: hypothetical protein R3C68_19540 [Myxococcota bacterium]
MPQERFVTTTDGLRLYTSTEGQGPTLVLCDGLGCDGFIWRYLRAQFSPTYQIVHWNYRAHGLSEAQGTSDRSTLISSCVI